MTARRRRGGARFDLLFLGDTCFGESYQKRREDQGRENILKTRGYEHALMHMKSMMARADFVVANLETPLTTSTASPFFGKKPHIHKGDVDLTPRSLRRNHVTAVSLANNHSLDHGVDGLDETLHALRAQRIAGFGAGFSQREADEPLIVDLNADVGCLRVAVFAAYDDPNVSIAAHGQQAAEGAQICGLAPERIGARIRALRDAHPDLLAIAFPHWGRNYRWRTARQRGLAAGLFDAGVDLIVGHGAHMLQEVDCRGGKWAIFSLGNFVFNSPGRYAKRGAPPFSLVGRLVARARPVGWSVSLQVYPIVTDNGITNYQPRFASDAEFKIVRDVVASKSQAEPLRVGRDRNGSYLEVSVREAGPIGKR